MNPTTLLSGLGAAITADPSLGGASTTGRESNPGGGDLFLALVNGLLQGSSQEDLGVVPGPAAGATAGTAGEGATTGVPPVITTGLVPVPTSADDAQAEPAADEPETDQASAVSPDLSMLSIALAAQPAVLVAATAGSGGRGEPAATDAVTTMPTATAVPAASTGGSAQAGTGSGADQQSDDSTAAPSDASASTPPVTPDQAASAPPTGPRGEVRADAVPAQSTGVPTAVAPPAAVTTVTTPTTSADLPRVADQVFPEVLRATSNAENGTSRVTVKLNPESLGEVRVVLTQRGGELEVTLAGGADARRALTEGAPELRRLLESVGRADSRIFIRDLPNGAAPAPVATASGPAARTDVSTDLAGGAWSGAGSPGGEPAPDRDSSRHRPGSSTATDGIPDVTTRSRPIQTAGRSHAGLDLSM
jgi:hypothetical protein